MRDIELYRHVLGWRQRYIRQPQAWVSVAPNVTGFAVPLAATPWDLPVWVARYQGAQEISAPAGFVSAENPRAHPPVAPPGRYVARLSASGQQHERSFEIKKDPRIAATDDDLRAQFDLMVQIHNRLSEVTTVVERLRKARQQLEARKPTSAGDAQVASAREKLRAIEGALTRLADPSPGNLPPKTLNNRLAALTGAVGQADARPTRQMYAVFEELSAAVAERLRQLDHVLKELPR